MDIPYYLFSFSFFLFVLAMVVFCGCTLRYAVCQTKETESGVAQKQFVGSIAILCISLCSFMALAAVV